MKKFLFFVFIFNVFSLFATTPDEQACEYARKANDNEVWENYLKKFPQGSCAFEAEGEILKSKNQPNSSSKEKNFYFTPKIGFGIDFEGNQGMTVEQNQFTQNQLGLSFGLDFDWVIYRNNDRKMFFGFGLGAQYWAPTTKFGDTKHYLRAPLLMNLSYEFETKNDIVTSFAPKFSAGFNNNFLITDEEYVYGDKIKKYKASFAWALGFSIIFKETYVLTAAIGGDAGNKNPNNITKNKTLYGHHEFITMEIGFRIPDLR